MLWSQGHKNCNFCERCLAVGAEITITTGKLAQKDTELVLEKILGHWI